MKKLLIYFTLLLSIAAQAQHPGYVKRNTRDQVLASAADSTMHMPAGSVLSLGGGWNGAGAFRYSTTDSAEYLWTGTRWLRASQEIRDGIVSGLGVSWNSGLIYDVAAGVAYVGGVRVTYPGGQVTLTTADPTDPRIDNIVLNIDGTVTAIAGDPSPNPSKPTPDASTQLELTFAQLDAGASVPNGVTATKVWDGEGADLWTGTTTGTVAFNNTVHAQSGTHSTFVSSGGLSGTQQITYKGATAYSVADYQNIKLYVWLNVALAGARAPDVSLLNGNNVVTQVRPMTDLGLNRNLINQWQTIIIPLSGFNYTNSSFTGIRIGRFNNTIGNFYIDNIQLGTLPIINISGAYLPLSFPDDQIINGNDHSLTMIGLTTIYSQAGNGTDYGLLQMTNGLMSLSSTFNTSDQSGLTTQNLYAQVYANKFTDIDHRYGTYLTTYADSIVLFQGNFANGLDRKLSVYLRGGLGAGGGSDSVLVKTSDGLIQAIAQSDLGGGGGGGWALTGTTTITGDATIDADGHVLLFSNGAAFIELDPDSFAIGTSAAYMNGETTTGIAFHLPSGNLLISDLQEFADNAAAITGGLPTDALYRSGGFLRIVD